MFFSDLQALQSSNQQKKHNFASLNFYFESVSSHLKKEEKNFFKGKMKLKGNMEFVFCMHVYIRTFKKRSVKINQVTNNSLLNIAAEVCFVCDNYTYTALQSVRGIILTENVVMFQCFVLFLVALFFWKVYNSFLVVWQNRHRETGTPSENYDEETWFGIQINEETQLFPKGNLSCTTLLRLQSSQTKIVACYCDISRSHQTNTQSLRERNQFINFKVLLSKHVSA